MIETTNSIPEELRRYLHIISADQVLQKRSNNECATVLKFQGNLYLLSDSDLEERIKSALGKHLCSDCTIFSGTLCPKVLDLPRELCLRKGYTRIEGIADSKRIEKYDFITEGIECFNTCDDFFVVTKCARFENADLKRKKEKEKERRDKEKNANKK